MCEPATIATTLMVVSTVSQGYAAKQQGKYENEVAKYNARIQENEAIQVRNRGVEEENIMREKTARLLSKQRAQLGAAGVDLTTGSAADLQQDVELFGEVDALRIRSNFQREADVLQQQAEFTKATGRAAEKRGRQAFTGSLLSAGGQAFGAPVSSKWFT